MAFKIAEKQMEDLRAQLEKLTTEVASLTGKRNALQDVERLRTERDNLAAEVTNLKIEKDRINEDRAREKREVEHATGLLRAQVDWERFKAVDEATLTVQKENLSAERKRFEEQMEFHRDQIKGEIERFTTLLANVMDKLPNTNVALSAEVTAPARASSGTRGR